MCAGRPCVCERGEAGDFSRLLHHFLSKQDLFLVFQISRHTVVVPKTWTLLEFEAVHWHIPKPESNCMVVSISRAKVVCNNATMDHTPLATGHEKNKVRDIFVLITKVARGVALPLTFEKIISSSINTAFLSHHQPQKYFNLVRTFLFHICL